MQTHAVMVIVLFSSQALLAQFQERDSTSTTYETYLELLARDSTDIDYLDFRRSYLESNAYNERLPYTKLKQKMFKALAKGQHNKLMRICQQMLDYDYTSLYAHMYLQKAAKVTGDTALHRKHKTIEFGLLYSITHTGDGRSCETSWVVTQIEEEYFIMDMIDAVVQGQSLEGYCDRMVTLTDGVEEVLWFDAYFVLMRNRMPRSN